MFVCASSCEGLFGDPETASDDPLCVHHLTLGKSCAAPRSLFRASQAGVYRFEFDSCVGSTRLHIATADGGKELAVAESATAPACSSLAYTVDKANTYLVTIDADDSANCKSLVPLKLRIRH
jgi:hypothetical protein